ncbi:hypothetical protein C8J47_0891 [Sphingomonas sp. PP-F2F-G114-C0414]|uniref:hypothetical protein n=1 Tax=Sphingomonas sp. PP-F2F-G114-C0414 TaxID=2135662 RepID=UPI000F126CDA|nr:hypothetical protein [Sphingomonas sp. PP-F2F-G114-C0414]RMB37303.1 hypothetical protein C8J47_0891 [Sphingomonas sp. PP-F2F-G114-C0414]
MLEFITSVRPYLEVLSFTATIILVIGLILARSQLVAFSRDANVRNERLAKEKAIEAATRYLSEYIRLANIEYDKIVELKLPTFNGEVDDFSAFSVSTNLRRKMNETLLIAKTDLSSINELELIASYFISRVADEKTGFRIIGRSYCATVKSNYHIISILRGNDTAQPYWYNIVALYQLWAPSLTREELESSSIGLAQRLAALPTDRSVAPLGC